MIPTRIYFKSSCALSPVSLAGVLLPGGLGHTVQSLLQEVLPEGLSHLSQRIHCRRSDQLINMQEPGQSECARWQNWKKKQSATGQTGGEGATDRCCPPGCRCSPWECCGWPSLRPRRSGDPAGDRATAWLEGRCHWPTGRPGGRCSGTPAVEENTRQRRTKSNITHKTKGLAGWLAGGKYIK